jgi:hypothetical protein
MAFGKGQCNARIFCFPKTLILANFRLLASRQFPNLGMLRMVIDLTPNLPYDMRDRAEQVAKQAAGFADLVRYGAGSRPNRVSPISQSTTCLNAS